MKIVTIIRRSLTSISLVALIGLLGATPALGQISMWAEDFSDVSDWNTAGTSISTDGNIGTITADVDYGKAEAASWMVAEFGCGPDTDRLHINCTAVTGRYHVKIMEEVPPFTEINLLTSDAPGVHDIDVGAATGWIGQRSFKIVVWVEWALPASASFDEMSLVNAAGWADDFEPAHAGWRDDNTNPGFNATIADQAGPYAVIQEVPNVAWGKVLSPVLTINVDNAPTLTAVVQSDAILSNFVFGIQEEEGSYQYFELGRGYDAGIFVYDYKAITGWTGSHVFSIQIGVESNDIDGWVVFDSIKLDCSAAPPPSSTENSSWGEVKSLFR